ncbi:MAG: hypothetical protein EP343_01810 [Deltaproteobacteria bacterium]|nr:MAG: hypothetical protein EP343_01810 [Deltaproteobacteria bacterium]
MRVRWSQLVYRTPGSDNEVGLVRVMQTSKGDRLCLEEDLPRPGEQEVGYLAMVPAAQACEEELDVWVDIDGTAFITSDRDLWHDSYVPEQTGLFATLRMLWWRWGLGSAR